ncbi:MAG: hypothetical protein FWH52_05045 [Synergistaceae bacterium]|nr:hypothetical protein [Synergistaceae bacterium]
MKEYYGVILTDEVEDKVDALCEKIRMRIAKEKMTPRERYAKYTRGEKTDRMPVTALPIGLHAAAFANLKPPQLYEDPQVTLLAYLSHLEYFQYDTLSMFRFSLGENVLGGTLTKPSDGSLPLMIKGAIECGADIDKFKLPVFPDCYKYETMHWQLWMIKVLQEKLGDIMPLFGFSAMPGGINSYMLPMEKHFVLLKTNRPLAHSIAAITSLFNLEWLRELEKSGVDYIRMIGKGDVVSEAIQREYEFGYIARAVNAINVPLYVHSAGDTSHVIESYAQSGVAGFEAHSGTPIKKAKEIAMKYNCTYTAHVDAHILLHGDREAIRKEVKRVIDATREDPVYYKIALTTDPLDYSTPNENVMTYVEAAKEFAQY